MSSKPQLRVIVRAPDSGQVPLEQLHSTLAQTFNIPMALSPIELKGTGICLKRTTSHEEASMVAQQARSLGFVAKVLNEDGQIVEETNDAVGRTLIGVGPSGPMPIRGQGQEPSQPNEDQGYDSDDEEQLMAEVFQGVRKSSSLPILNTTASQSGANPPGAPAVKFTEDPNQPVAQAKPSPEPLKPSVPKTELSADEVSRKLQSLDAESLVLIDGTSEEDALTQTPARHPATKPLPEQTGGTGPIPKQRGDGYSPAGGTGPIPKQGPSGNFQPSPRPTYPGPMFEDKIELDEGQRKFSPGVHGYAQGAAEPLSDSSLGNPERVSEQGTWPAGESSLDYPNEVRSAEEKEGGPRESTGVHYRTKNTALRKQQTAFSRLSAFFYTHPRLRILLGFLFAVGLGSLAPTCYSKAVMDSEFQPVLTDLSTVKAHGYVYSPSGVEKNASQVEDELGKLQFRYGMKAFLMWFAISALLGYAWLRLTEER